jgi:hypothetical protein
MSAMKLFALLIVPASAYTTTTYTTTAMTTTTYTTTMYTTTTYTTTPAPPAYTTTTEKPEKPKSDPTMCYLTFGSVVDDVMGAILNIWSASKRCDVDYVGKSERFPGIACVEDVSNSVAQLLKTIGKIVEMIKSCDVYGKIGHIMSKCTMAVGGLVANTARLVAGSSAIADSCTEGKPAEEVLELLTPIGKCHKVTASSVMLVASSQTIVGLAKKSCKGHECVAHILDLVHVLSEFGMHFAGAFDDCASVKAPDGSLNTEYQITNQQARCASDIFEVVSGLTGLAHHGYVVKGACAAPKTERLYSEYADGVGSSSHTMTWSLVAAIPIASLVSFFGGLRMAKSHKARQTRTVSAPQEALGQSEQSGLMEMM